MINMRKINKMVKLHICIHILVFGCVLKQNEIRAGNAIAASNERI